jgi:hypothetical protein
MKDIFEPCGFDKGNFLTPACQSAMESMSACLKDFDLKVADILEEAKCDISIHSSILDIARHRVAQETAEGQVALTVLTNIWFAQTDLLWEEIRKENSVLAHEWPTADHVDPAQLPDRFLRRLLGHERAGSCKYDDIVFTEEQFVWAYRETGYDLCGLTPKWRQWAADNPAVPGAGYVGGAPPVAPVATGDGQAATGTGRKPKADGHLAADVGATTWEELEIKVLATGIKFRKANTADDFPTNPTGWGAIGLKGKHKAITLLRSISRCGGTFPRNRGEDRRDEVHDLNTAFKAAFGLTARPFANVRKPLGTQSIIGSISWGGESR